MSRKLYLECYAGISGDMAVAALLDLGADETALRKALRSLNLRGYTVEISRVKKSGLDVCDFAVRLDAEHENRDHDMEYLHGHAQACLSGQAHEHCHVQEHVHGSAHVHTHEHEPGHPHEHEQMPGHPHEPGHLYEHEHMHAHAYEHTHEHEKEHGHAHLHHSHEHRGLPEILDIIERSGLTAGAKARAIRMFDILADAEAKAHGVPRDEVHFHEVGAVDSIVDIAAVSVCLDNLGIEDVVIPVLYEGCGFVRCQHGVIPVPVPATLNIVQAHGLRLHRTETEGEFVTPTGAAIAAAIRTSESLPHRYRVIRVGLGAGKRNYERPSILRAMLIEESETGESEGCESRNRENETVGSEGCGNGNGERVTGGSENGNPGIEESEAGERAAGECESGVSKSPEEVYKLECNVDDCSGETLGYAMERLLEAGALEVNFTPVFTKKNRPAHLVTVLCRISERERMERILFTETTTIGIRRQRMERSVLQRENRVLSTSLGDVKVKALYLPGEVRLTPEYESVAEVARAQGLPYPRALRMIEEQLSQKAVG